MKTTNGQKAMNFLASQPLVFQIQSLRRWFGDDGLSQKELADLAGIPDRQLRFLESLRTLPQSVRVLLAIAMALNTNIENLIIPDLVEDLRATINARRATTTTAATAPPPANLPCRRYDAGA
jgi:transcriptional regulator with XRE-family HTH domain